MEQPDATDQTKICRECGRRNVSRAQFCARCGQTLNDETALESRDVDSTQATSVFVPVSQPLPEDSWAQAETQQTTALPVQTAEWSSSPPARSPSARRESPRGLLLGILASMLIIAVLGIYVYAAWLTPSLRDELTGWLPW
jgi:hypothetical protein